MDEEETIEEPASAGEDSEKIKKRGKKTKPRSPGAQQSVFPQCFYEADYLLFKGFCFFIYGAYGGFIPYLPMYLKELFLGASFVGIIMGIRPLIQCIGAPFWGIIADRYHAGRIIFLGSLIAWIVKALILLTVRPKNQHCIEIYRNNTANVSYVYAYDLWNTVPVGDQAYWLVLPLDHPIVVEKNKIVTVHESRGKETTTHRLLPGNVLKKSGPVKQATKTEEKETKHAKSNHSGALHETKKREVFMTESETNSSILKTFLDGDKEISAISKSKQLMKMLKLKIARDVKVYNEELKAPIQFITQVDESEINFMFVLFLLIVIIAEFFESPTYPLSDASLLKRLGEERAYYGRIRMWGSLGWAVSSAMVGLIVLSSRFKLCQVIQSDYVTSFYIFIAFVAAAFVHGLWFRFSYDEEKKFEEIGQIVPMLINLRQASFLIATLYTGFCYGILVHFVNWYIDDLGGSSAIMGSAAAARETAALIMFAFSGTTLEALGNLNTMVFCLMSYIICFICYSILEDPWMAVALEILDGGTYGLVWSTCVNYMSSVGFQLGVIETTQGILQGIFWGLGNGGGTIISGVLIEVHGVINTMRAFAIAGTVVLAILVTSQYTASLLEEKDKQRKEYQMLSEESDELKSEEGVERIKDETSRQSEN